MEFKKSENVSKSPYPLILYIYSIPFGFINKENLALRCYNLVRSGCGDDYRVP